MKKRSLFIAFMVVLSAIACNEKYKNMDDGIYAEFTTNHGDFIAQLYYKKAPLTVANFVSLAEGDNPLVSEQYKGKKFYDGLTFHRIIDGFMIQGGDPEGNGMGGPGYEFDNETNTGLKHDSKGILSMANAGPDTNGSQFFITLQPQPRLDGGYSVFGKVVKGQEVVDSIGKVKTDQRDKPKEDVVMEHVKIVKIGKEAKDFNAAKVFKEKKEAKLKAQKAREKELKSLVEGTPEGYKKTESGLKYKITKKVDSGKSPQPGQTVEVYYKGMLPNGTIFDQNLEKDGNPIKFPVGVGRVIKGWDEGLQLLKVGEEARFVIPSELGYGSRGAGGVIPPNATLIFDVKLAKIDD